MQLVQQLGHQVLRPVTEQQDVLDRSLAVHRFVDPARHLVVEDFRRGHAGRLAQHDSRIVEYLPDHAHLVEAFEAAEQEVFDLQANRQHVLDLAELLVEIE